MKLVEPLLTARGQNALHRAFSARNARFTET
jgi:hypothetical protein